MFDHIPSTHAVLFPIKVKCVVTETHPIKVSNFPLLVAGNDCCVSQKVYRILLDLYFKRHIAWDQPFPPFEVVVQG